MFDSGSHTKGFLQLIIKKHDINYKIYIRLVRETDFYFLRIYCIQCRPSVLQTQADDVLVIKCVKATRAPKHKTHLTCVQFLNREQTLKYKRELIKNFNTEIYTYTVWLSIVQK